MEQPGDELLRPSARQIGVVYLLYFLAAFLATFLASRAMMPGDAAATILAHAGTYRSAFAGGLVANALYIALTAMLYTFFRPVNPTTSLMAAFFSLVGCALQIIAGVLQIAPLLLLTDSRLSAMIGAPQLQAMSLASLMLYGQTFKAGLVCFGIYDLLLGYLIVRSTFVPRALGVVLILAGLGWLTFMWPSRVNVLSSVVLPLGAVAEILFMLWLISRGETVSRGQEETHAPASV
jgi:Domain of unknown function (DUF4386)